MVQEVFLGLLRTFYLYSKLAQMLGETEGAEFLYDQFLPTSKWLFNFDEVVFSDWKSTGVKIRNTVHGVTLLSVFEDFFWALLWREGVSAAGISEYYAE